MYLKLNEKYKTSSAFVAIAVLIMNLNFSIIKAEKNFTTLVIYRDYLSNMVKIMDREIMPCINFFQHACGNIDYYKEYLMDVEPFLYNRQDHYIFFETHKQEFKTNPGIFLRDTYDKCKSSQKHNAKKRRNWLRMISGITFLKHDHKLLRKWPFLQYQWEKYKQKLDLNWPALAAEFSAHGLNIFFNVFFAKNAIYITPNYQLKCADLNEFKERILPLLGVRNQIADIIGTELWVLCRQLKGEIEISTEIDNVTNLLNDGTINEFMQHFFLRLNFTESEVENAHKMLVYIDTLKETMTLLHSTNPRIIYNFILWQAYEQLTNIDDCFTLTQEFESLLQVEYWNWHTFQSHIKRDVALASYLFHTTRFQKHYRKFITSTTWERLFQNRSERKDLNIERTIKNYAKQYLDLENYTQHYQYDLMPKENITFYSLLFELRRLQLRYNFLQTNYDDNEDLNFFQEFINFSILLVYRPRLHYFASYDREMWHNSKILQDSDAYYAAVDCLHHQTSLNIENSDIYKDLSMEQIKEIYNFYATFNEALGDYKFWLESENFAIAEDFLLEYFELDSLRVAFYAVAQQFCGRNDLIYSSLINRSYMNMPEFQEAFQCESMDEMNPVTKCMIDY